jgi:hypothetical protein
MREPSFDAAYYRSDRRTSDDAVKNGLNEPPEDGRLSNPCRGRGTLRRNVPVGTRWNVLQFHQGIGKVPLFPGFIRHAHRQTCQNAPHHPTLHQ